MPSAWFCLPAYIVLLVTGCATGSLPDIKRIETSSARAVPLENARGPLSRERSAEIIGKLKERAGDISSLDRRVAVEQAAVDSPLVVGNKATLLQDGPATYKAMLAAIGSAKHHINLETYIIEDDEVGREFSNVLIRKREQALRQCTP